MNLLNLFCSVHDFCKVFLPEWKKQLITDGKKKRNRSGKLDISEIMTILILFHQSRFRDFKNFYLNFLSQFLTKEFPDLPSYQRFVAITASTFIPLCAYLQSTKKISTGIAFIDSTSIVVCTNKRTNSHKIFKGLAKLGKTTKGWFYGFKLHLICNHLGELISCNISPGNMDDRKPVSKMAEGLKGKLFGDKGYISKSLSSKLLSQGLQLITGVKNNMQNKLMSLFDRLMLRKRSMIESVNNQLKNVFQVEHTRHRNPINGFINIITGLLAYIHHDRKPKVKLRCTNCLIGLA